MVLDHHFRQLCARGIGSVVANFASVDRHEDADKANQALKRRGNGADGDEGGYSRADYRRTPRSPVSVVNTAFTLYAVVHHLPLSAARGRCVLPLDSPGEKAF